MSIDVRHSVGLRVGIAAAALVLLLSVVFLVEGGSADSADEVLVCADDAESRLSPLFEERMGNVALVDMDRQPVMLHDLVGRRLTTVIYCSYRCPCSDGYIDRLRTLRSRYEARGVAFVAVNANADETVDGMEDYIRRKDYPLPVYRDEMSAAADMMHATVTPEVFVFDRDWQLQYHGRIDDDKSGFFIEEESLRLALDSLLAGQELRHREKMSLGCAILRDHPLQGEEHADERAAGTESMQ